MQAARRCGCLRAGDCPANNTPPLRAAPFPALKVDDDAGVAALGPATTPAADDAAQPWRRQPDVRPPIGRDPGEKPQSMFDMLPDWVGYGGLYLVSAGPVLIAVSVIVVLFLNSLR